MLTCGGCGFDAPADFAFCPKCGRKLGAEPPPAPSPPAAPEADRRLATILFADLTGFTAIAERLDPEDVRALQTDLFDALRGVLEREEAFVEKFVGDAVMAVFGAPVAHEDDPQRALRAALAMHERAAALSDRWRGRIAQPLRLHVGVNSGRVVAGHIGNAAGAAYAVTGDAVNVAARLQAAAEPGTTLVSAETQALARDAFEFEPGAALQLKGKAQPLAVFELLRSRERVRGATLAPRLIGRAPELDALRASFAAMQQGAAQLVVVDGDAGIGKSRLVDAFVDALRAAPAAGRAPTLRRTHCAANEARPYGAIARFFRDGFNLAPDDDLAAVQAKVDAGLAALAVPAEDSALVVAMAGVLLGLPGLAGAADAEPERLQRQITAALRVVLEHRLRQAPLVLVVEDVQWADAASLAALATMADGLHAQPLLMLLTCRDAAALDSLATGRAVRRRIALAPLARAQADELLASYFGAAGSAWLPERLRTALLERAGGNPYFLEALVRGLVEAHVLVADGERWRCDENAAAAEVPATLEGLLLARLDRLAPRLRQCLQEAAVIGANFDAELLRELGGAAVDAPALDALAAQGHIVRAAGSASRWRFAASMMRDVVYHNLLLRRRTELHARIARLLEARRAPGDGPFDFDELQAMGEHFCRGDEPLRGARCLAAAGDWARAIYANDDAIGLYRRARAALAARPDRDAEVFAEIVEALADVLALTGQRDAAFAGFGEALGDARARGAARREARIQRKLAALHWDAGARETSRTCLDAGLARLAGEGGCDIERAHLLQELGRHAFRTGDSAAAVRWAEQALADARRCAGTAAHGSAAARDAATAVAQALNTLGAALARLDRPEEAVAAIEQSVAVAQDEGLLQAACRGYANLGVLYAGLNPAQAIATCRRGLETAQRIGDLGFQSRLYANLAVAYCALTNQCDIEGLRAAEAAIELDRRLGQLDHLAVPLIVLAQIHQCHGDPQQALRFYAEACELAERIAEPQLLFPVYDGLGTLYLDLGDTERAEAYLTRANEVCETAGLDRDALVVLPFLC